MTCAHYGPIYSVNLEAAVASELHEQQCGICRESFLRPKSATQPTRRRKLISSLGWCAIAWCYAVTSGLAAPVTITEYTYDAAGNIVAVQRNSTEVGLISFAPTSGPAGTTVILSGTGFFFNLTPSANVVRFNGEIATVTAAARNQLTVQVPAQATTGPISVTVGTATFASDTSFTVTPSLARIEGSPTTYSAIQPAYAAAVSGNTIQAQAGVFLEYLVFGRPAVSVALKGGYDQTFTTNPGSTFVTGSLTISDGAVTVYGIVLD